MERPASATQPKHTNIGVIGLGIIGRAIAGTSPSQRIFRLRLESIAAACSKFCRFTGGTGGVLQLHPDFRV